NETCARRYVTTTAPQALMLLNDRIVLDIGRQFALRVQREAGNDPVKLIDGAFELALGRKPHAEESSAMRRFLEDRTALHREKDEKDAVLEAVADLPLSVLNLNDFFFVFCPPVCGSAGITLCIAVFSPAVISSSRPGMVLGALLWRRCSPQTGAEL